MFSNSTNLWEFDLVKLLEHPGIIKTTRQAMVATECISFAAFDEASINLAAGFNTASEGRDNLRHHISKVFLSPPDDTLANMLEKGWVVNVPGNVTGQEIRRHPPNSIATGLGHMKQVRQVHSHRHRAKNKSEASAMVFSTDDDYYNNDEDGQVRDVDSDGDDDDFDDWGEYGDDYDEYGDVIDSDDDEEYQDTALTTDDTALYADGDLLIWGIHDFAILPL